MNYSRVFLTAAALCGAAGLARADSVEIDNIRAVVHDAIVTRVEVEGRSEAAAKGLMSQYRNQPQVFERELTKVLNENLEDSLKRQLMLHDYKSSGYNIPEPIIESSIQEEIERRGGRERLMKTLQAGGMTFEKYRQQIRENIIIGALRSKNISQAFIVSPHKIEAYYNANQDKYKVGDEVKLRRIMVNKAADADQEAARKLAGEIRSKLKGGANFSEMASIYSQSADNKDGGLWGWVEKTALRKELADAVAGLKPGEISEVVELGTSEFILMVEETRTAHNRPLADVRVEIENALKQEEMARLEKQYIDRLRRKTFVRYF